MSYHLFIINPFDTPLYSLTYLSTRPVSGPTSTLASQLPSWSTSAFSGTVAALSGATSVKPPGPPGTAQGKEDRHVVMMIANASLDAIEDVQRTNGSMYLKAIDRFNEWTVSAFITPGNMKLVLLHEPKNDEGIRLFFMEVWENYVKLQLNPFHNYRTPIRSPVFDGRVRVSAKKYL
ncbi:transport protein particle complex subunit [Calocera viscosa TUFC12733]|uniref:Transport protein particle complex subunit n=1 Tax=Calocera viscosa (strain TUFC12733) TaxID=1330018 RepID=A0A167FVA1_CALVF|nr:transport protein particle complex subunit [Calocera viscosa TUFC12733]